MYLQRYLDVTANYALLYLSKCEGVRLFWFVPVFVEIVKSLLTIYDS